VTSAYRLRVLQHHGAQKLKLFCIGFILIEFVAQDMHSCCPHLYPWDLLASRQNSPRPLEPRNVVPLDTNLQNVVQASYVQFSCAGDAVGTRQSEQETPSPC
jgi:hypothetical protein